MASGISVKIVSVKEGKSLTGITKETATARKENHNILGGLMNKPCLLILRYLIGKYGAEFLARYIIDNHCENLHVSKNPKRKIAKEVSDSRLD